MRHVELLEAWSKPVVQMSDRESGSRRGPRWIAEPCFDRSDVCEAAETGLH